MPLLPSLASFWHGGPLTPLELASLHSFRSLGHPVAVYSYEPVPNLPADVVAGDAADLLPSRRVALHRESGSPSLHSNFLRYRMLRRTPHMWVDLDLIALRPLVFPTRYVFGRQRDDGSVNGAILALPPDSPALRRLLRLAPGTRGVPPHITSWRERAALRLRTWGRGMPVEDWPWGSAGPRALTTILGQTGEIRHALPREAFYPIGFKERHRLLRPGLGPDSFGSGTWAVHLWAKGLRGPLAERFGGRPPESGFVGWAIERARRDGYIPEGLLPPRRPRPPAP